MSKNPYYFIGPNPTCDLIIMSPEGKILTVERSDESPACPGMVAFPGGFINTIAKKNEVWVAGEETPEQAAKRETQEETNLKIDEKTIIYPVGIYEGNNRDPRDNEISWSKSHVFFVILDEKTFNEQKQFIIGQDDVKKDGIHWRTPKEIESIEMAFDHKKIFRDAMQLYKQKIIENKIQSIKDVPLDNSSILKNKI